MNADDRFAPPAEEDLARLVHQAPLAWLLSPDQEDPLAAALPLVPQVDGQGRLATLRGHLARRNPLVGRLGRQPRALVLFMGPQGYISPSWMRDRSQAPTWNYASLQCVVDVQLQDAAVTEADLRELVMQQEAGRPQAWSVDDMGERFGRLSQGIIGLRASVRSVRARFKLGQDERDDVYQDITAALSDRAQSAELLAWMRHCNPGRLHGQLGQDARPVRDTD